MPARSVTRANSYVLFAVCGGLVFLHVRGIDPFRFWIAKTFLRGAREPWVRRDDSIGVPWTGGP